MTMMFNFLAFVGMSYIVTGFIVIRGRNRLRRLRMPVHKGGFHRVLFVSLQRPATSARSATAPRVFRVARDQSLSVGLGRARRRHLKRTLRRSTTLIVSTLERHEPFAQDRRDPLRPRFGGGRGGPSHSLRQEPSIPERPRPGGRNCDKRRGVTCRGGRQGSIIRAASTLFGCEKRLQRNHFHIRRA